MHYGKISQYLCCPGIRKAPNSPVSYLGCWPEAPTIHLDLSEKVVFLVEHLQGLVEALKYAVDDGRCRLMCQSARHM